jgi:hypothetical protein
MKRKLKSFEWFQHVRPIETVMYSPVVNSMNLVNDRDLRKLCARFLVLDTDGKQYIHVDDILSMPEFKYCPFRSRLRVVFSSSLKAWQVSYRVRSTFWFWIALGVTMLRAGICKCIGSFRARSQSGPKIEMFVIQIMEYLDGPHSNSVPL